MHFRSSPAHPLDISETIPSLTPCRDATVCPTKIVDRCPKSGGIDRHRGETFQTGRGRRRRWSADQKLAVLQEWQTGVPLEELCRKYAPRNAELDKLEREAREVTRGLWADPHPVLLWGWRKRE